MQDFVVFYPLAEAAMRAILDKLLDRVRQRHGLRERAIRLHLTEAAYALLIDEGYDPRDGARAMERAVERLLVPLLTQALLRDQIPDGAVACVDADGDELVLEPAGRAVRAASWHSGPGR